MHLFQLGDFTLASGQKSRWKVECDSLTNKDWEALAAMAAEVLPPFAMTIGVPTGGDPFARALHEHCSFRSAAESGGKPILLLCEDVLTTGGSMIRYLEKMKADDRKTPRGDTVGRIVTEDYVVRGVCVFARGVCPHWVTPLFQMPVKK